jgi:hypothetical protein
MLVLMAKGNGETMEVGLWGEMNGYGGLFYWLAPVV